MNKNYIFLLLVSIFGLSQKLGAIYNELQYEDEQQFGVSHGLYVMQSKLILRNEKKRDFLVVQLAEIETIEQIKQKIRKYRHEQTYPEVGLQNLENFVNRVAIPKPEEVQVIKNQIKKQDTLIAQEKNFLRELGIKIFGAHLFRALYYSLNVFN